MKPHIKPCTCKTCVEDTRQAMLKAVKIERERIEQLITDEMLICRHEGTPTSRLTSLFNRIK